MNKQKSRNLNSSGNPEPNATQWAKAQNKHETMTPIASVPTSLSLTVYCHTLLHVILVCLSFHIDMYMSYGWGVPTEMTLSHDLDSKTFLEHKGNDVTTL
jgi:hypothetical protein